VKIKVQSP